MSQSLSSSYWTSDFHLTIDDVGRIAQRIRDLQAGCNILDLARELIRSRIEYGPDTTEAVQATEATASVRLWDPAGSWQVGDRVIVCTLSPKYDRYIVLSGEIITFEPSCAQIRVDDRAKPVRKYNRAAPGSPEAATWKQTVIDAVNAMRSGGSVGHQVESIALQHGERILSLLISALRADRRFVEVNGRWFLRDMAHPLMPAQLQSVAWALAAHDTPQPVGALLPFASLPLVGDDRALLDLQVALESQPARFRSITDGSQQRWSLAAPPPGTFIPRAAAYDPRTYEVLCLPGVAVPPDVVRRLWNLNLLPAVVPPPTARTSA